MSFYFIFLNKCCNVVIRYKQCHGICIEILSRAGFTQWKGMILPTIHWAAHCSHSRKAWCCQLSIEQGIIHNVEGHDPGNYPMSSSLFTQWKGMTHATIHWAAHDSHVQWKCKNLPPIHWAAHYSQSWRAWSWQLYPSNNQFVSNHIDGISDNVWWLSIFVVLASYRWKDESLLNEHQRPSTILRSFLWFRNVCNERDPSSMNANWKLGIWTTGVCSFHLTFC